MRYINNNNGIALVTSLMFTALALVISMSLLYMVTSAIKSSGAMKQYKTAVEAAYGGTDLIAKDFIITASSFRTLDATSFKTTLASYMALPNSTVSDCLQTKLTLPRSQWDTTCTNTVSIFSPKASPDISFDLLATGGSAFKVYSKIVDTMDRKFSVLQGYSSARTQKTVTIAGNSDPTAGAASGLNISGSGGIGGSTPVPHYPYIYRIEVQGEKSTNAAQKANLSIMYAY